MLREAFDRHELNRYVGAIRDNLDAPALAAAAQQAAPVLDGAQDPKAAVRANLQDVTSALASSGGRRTPSVPFMARDPVHSILQSTLESKLRAQVEGMLAQAAKVEGTLRGNAGVGQIFEFRVPAGRGAALLFEGRAVHTSIL